MKYTLVHIICHYYVFQHSMIGLCMSFWILHTFRRDGTYSCASVIKNRAANCLVFGQYTSCNNYINTYYYVLLRIFLQTCCFMMSFVVFTHYYVLMFVFTYYGPPQKGVARHCLAIPFQGLTGRSIIDKNKQ